MGAIRELWWGKYSLASAFWGFYVFGLFGSMIVAMLIMVPFYLLHVSQIGFAFGVLVYASYWIIASVGVWRSADAYPFTRWWPVLAKIVVCLWAARIIWSLSDGGALSIMNRITSSGT